jgi:MFS family permease
MTEDVSLRQRLAVLSVALGTFTLVTNEFLPVALLTGIRTSLGVSQGAAATMVTVPAAVAAIASPTLAVAAGWLDRRPVLLLMAGLFILSDALSAAARPSGARGHPGHRISRLRSGLRRRPAPVSSGKARTRPCRRAPTLPAAL